MHKELTTLLKLLNGNLEKAPAFLQKVIIQYQRAQLVEAILAFVLGIACLFIAYKLLKMRNARQDNNTEYYNEWNWERSQLDAMWGSVIPWVCIGLVVFAIIMFVCCIYGIGDYISPVTSIIGSLTSN